MSFARTARLLLLAAPLALGVAACGKKDDAGAPASSATAVAKVPAPAGSSWTDTVAVTPDGGYLMGNPTAPIKVVEYGSLSCPHCAKLAQDGFGTLVGDYVASGRVNLEFRSYALHPQDVPLTMLAQCGGPSTFFPLVEELYKNFDAVSEATMKGADAANAAANQGPNQRFITISNALGFTEFFAARGISKDQANSCLADGANATKIAQAAEKFGADGIDSTPTILINGAKLDGATWDVLNAALQRAGVR